MAVVGGRTLLTSDSDLGQMSTKTERACARIRVRHHHFEEYWALMGTGRRFVGLYCHMPLPIPALIRDRPTHFGTRSKLGPLQAISILLWQSCTAIRRRTKLCSCRSRLGEVTGTSSLRSSGRRRCEAIKGLGCHNEA